MCRFVVYLGLEELVQVAERLDEVLSAQRQARHVGPDPPEEPRKSVEVEAMSRDSAGFGV